jgi:hypothetical protein
VYWAYTIFYIFLCISTQVACGVKTSTVLDCPPLDRNASPILFTERIQPFLIRNCGCHSRYLSNRRGAPAWLNFDTYDESVEHAEAMLHTIGAGTMPRNSTLDFDTRCVFFYWVQQGFLE